MKSSSTLALIGSKEDRFKSPKDISPGPGAYEVNTVHKHIIICSTPAGLQYVTQVNDLFSNMLNSNLNNTLTCVCVSAESGRKGHGSKRHFQRDASQSFNLQH